MFAEESDHSNQDVKINHRGGIQTMKRLDTLLEAHSQCDLNGPPIIFLIINLITIRLIKHILNLPLHNGMLLSVRIIVFKDPLIDLI